LKKQNVIVFLCFDITTFFNNNIPVLIDSYTSDLNFLFSGFEDKCVREINFIFNNIENNNYFYVHKTPLIKYTHQDFKLFDDIEDTDYGLANHMAESTHIKIANIVDESLM
jgi:hypothetical protein